MAQGFAGYQHERQIGRRNLVLADHPFGFGIAVGVNPPVGNAIPCQELPEAERLRRER